MASRKPTPELKAFGAELRRLREEAGITRAELAKRASVTSSYIGQVETGATRCRKDFAERLDQALQTGSALTDAWDDLLRSRGYPRFFRDFPKAESSAALLRAYEGTFVYGLFQIEGYARILLATDADFEGRMRRQAILEGKNPPTISVVLAESVLLRAVGDNALMREQLEHLVEMSLRENITLQIAPTAYYPGISGSFNLATQATGDQLLFLDTTTGGLTSNDPADVLHVVKAFTMLQAQVLSADDSRQHIRKVVSERWT